MERNQYYKALESVGQILQYYDTDKQFPVFGFGSKLRTNMIKGNRATHCFALNGNIFDPECDGLDGVLETYKKAVRNCDLYGPTHFNEVIKITNDMAEANEVSQ